MNVRDRVADEAAKLFFQKGIKSITMSDIARHLGISKRTLYENFKDKEELVGECVDQDLRKGESEMKSLIEESENAIDAMMRIYGKHLSDIYNMNKSVLHDLKKYHPQQYIKVECRQKEGVEEFLPLFEKGMEQGLIRTDVNFEIVLWMLKAQFRMLLENDYLPIDKFSLKDFFEAVILNFTRGIASEKGNKVIDEFVAKLNVSHQ